jgi:acetyltransferase-like isoleucine patch superfamily enzyme
VLHRLLTLARLWRCARVGAGSRALGHIWIHGEGQVEIGANVVLDGRVAPIELRTAKGGRLIIGDGVRIDGGSSLEAEGRIELRARVHVQGYAKIIDNHFHNITGNRHDRPPPGEVVLEEDAIICTGAILLPGAWVGQGARVGARAVLSKRIPPGVTVSGNPARVEAPASQSLVRER